MGPARSGDARDRCVQRIAGDLVRAGGGPVMVRGPWGSGVSWVLRAAVTALRPTRAVDHLVVRPGAVGRALDTAAGTSILVVDDAHHLPEGEADRLRDAVLNDGRSVLMGARAEVALVEPLEWMLSAGVAAAVDLAPLADGEVAAVMEEITGGKVHAGTRRHVQRLTQGRAGFVTDLTQAGLAAGSLELRNGLWRSTGEIAPELVERRLRFERRRMPDGLREPHTDLCRAGALPVTGVDDLVTSPQLADLVAYGYADVEGGLVVPSPPILRWASATVDGPLPAATAQRIIEATPSGTSCPELVHWRLAAGDRPADDEVVAAAAGRWQVGDPHGALQLLSEAGDSVAALRLTADLLAEVGRRHQAIEVLERLEAVSDSATREAARSERATITMWAGQRDRALAISRVGADEPDAPPAAVISHALLSLEGGDLDSAASVASSVMGEAHAASAATAIVATVAALRGEGHRAVELARAARAGHTRTGLEADVTLVTLVLALGEQGALVEAEEIAAAGYREALDESRHSQAWMALCRLRVHLYRGDLDSSAAMALESSELFSDLEHPAGLLLALAGQAMAAAGMGDVPAASAAGEEMAAIGRVHVSFLEPDIRRGLGWASLAKGDLAAAKGHLEAAVQIAERTGSAALTSIALHDLARFGYAREVTDQMDDLATRLDTRWAQPRAAYVRGLARESPSDLLDAAEGFHEIGADLHAVEAACEGAALAHMSGERALERRANALVRHLPRPAGVVTPPLVRADTSGRYRLTPREREVAQRAAEGATNRSIAESLGVSIRTVENMLHRSYHKLGVTGRTELIESLGASGAPG